MRPEVHGGASGIATWLLPVTGRWCWFSSDARRPARGYPRALTDGAGGGPICLAERSECVVAERADRISAPDARPDRGFDGWDLVSCSAFKYGTPQRHVRAVVVPDGFAVASKQPNEPFLLERDRPAGEPLQLDALVRRGGVNRRKERIRPRTRRHAGGLRL